VLLPTHARAAVAWLRDLFDSMRWAHRQTFQASHAKVKVDPGPVTAAFAENRFPLADFLRGTRLASGALFLVDQSAFHDFKYIAELVPEQPPNGMFHVIGVFSYLIAGKSIDVKLRIAFYRRTRDD